MKKLKKILAILSAAVLTNSMVIYPVSAEGIAEEIFIQDRGVIYNGHKNHPAKRTVETTYMGILLTMPDGEAPTAEELGLDECEITDYTSAQSFCGLYGTTDGEGLLTNGSLVTMTEGNENSYLVSSESLTEESAIELVKKLKIRGVVSNADICYETCVDVADFYVTHKETSFTVECHDLEEYVSNNHEPTAEEHSLYGFEELAESAGLTIEKLSVKKSRYTDNYVIDYDLRFDHDKYTENIAQLYDELQVVSKKINERYADDENYISSGTDWIQYVFDDEPMNGLLSVEPTWGDATNDDMIDIYDAVEIAKHVMNLNELDDDTVLLADINRDGKTNLYDAIEISKTFMA